MDYPVLEVPFLGGSMLIAAIAVFHVIIAHFSVGSGFLMTWAERRARREGDAETLAFLESYAWLVLLVPYVLGTVTGAGIWFVVGVVAPRAISLLIHQFVWFWAMEWVFFIIEVVAIHLYVFRYRTMEPAAHERTGWIFAGASLATLVVINAILSFMLTPGSWVPLAPGAVWAGVASPSWIPTTVLRFLVALALAGAGALVLLAFSSRATDRVRAAIAPLAYRFILGGAATVPFALWTAAVLPERARTFLEGGAPVMVLFLSFGLASALIILVASAAALLRDDTRVSTQGACLLALLCVVVFGSFEFVREGCRKPFLVEGFMYPTGMTAPRWAGADPEGSVLRAGREGVLAVVPWARGPWPLRGADGAVGGGTAAAGATIPMDKGRAVYRAACMPCHCLDGYNALRPLVRGWSEETLLHALGRLHELKPSMPPFACTDDERRALATFLHRLSPTGGEGR